MLHTAPVIKCRLHRILICTVDSDAVIWVVQELPKVVDELWLALGKGKNFTQQYMSLLHALDKKRHKSLAVFHAHSLDAIQFQLLQDMERKWHWNF